MSKELPDVKVEIILPNYNSENYLTETINSIINQTYKNWHLYIIDDFSISAIFTSKFTSKYSP